MRLESRRRRLSGGCRKHCLKSANKTKGLDCSACCSSRIINRYSVGEKLTKRPSIVIVCLSAECSMVCPRIWRVGEDAGRKKLIASTLFFCTCDTNICSFSCEKQPAGSQCSTIFCATKELRYKENLQERQIMR